MTDLQIERSDYTNATIADDGTITLVLTDDGERKLVTAAVRRQSILARQDERRAAKLAKLTNAELLALATNRFGGPTPDVAAEAFRRVRACADSLTPVFKTMRSAGMIPASTT